MIAGLILAGGRSRRFGEEKALAGIGGTTLIARVTEVLQGACAPLAIAAPAASGAAAFARQRGLTLIADAPGASRGPLAGLIAGFDWAESHGAEILATAPCDMPFLPANLVARLAAGLGDADAAVAASPSDLQPLCALWRIAPAQRVLRPALTGGRHPPVRQILADLSAAHVRFESDAPFANVNTTADLTSALASNVAAGPPLRL